MENPQPRRRILFRLRQRKTVYLILTLCSLAWLFFTFDFVTLFALGIWVALAFWLWVCHRRTNLVESRFQFRLRTLMIVVTLLAVVCGSIGWELKIIRQRKATLTEIEVSGGAFVCYVPGSLFSSYWGISRKVGKIPDYDAKRYMPHFRKIPSAFRRWIGDEVVFEIWLPDTVPELEVDRIEGCFPEAAVQRGGTADEAKPLAARK